MGPTVPPNKYGLDFFRWLAAMGRKCLKPWMNLDLDHENPMSSEIRDFRQPKKKHVHISRLQEATKQLLTPIHICSVCQHSCIDMETDGK